jgi:hypothetical protein
LVGSGDGSCPGWVAVGVVQAGGGVWVGKMTAPEVTVGLNTAVMVRSGVGKTIGVGDVTNGKLQASIAKARAETARIEIRLVLFMLASQRNHKLTYIFIIDDLAQTNLDHYLKFLAELNRELTLDW